MSVRKAGLIIIALLGIWTAVLPAKEQKSKTWYLQKTSQWKQLSEDCKEALVKGNKYFNKGKYRSAAHWFKKLLQECDSESESELYAEVLRRQFVIAKAYLYGRKEKFLWLFNMTRYQQGVRMMENIAEHASSPPRRVGMEAEVEIAKSYERRGKSNSDKYFSAYHKWQEIFEDYESDKLCSASGPTGVIGKDALLGMARCRLNSYRGPHYDASLLGGRPLTEKKYESAKGCYEIFQMLYPRDAEKLGIDEKIRKINEKLALKDFYVAQYYHRQQKGRESKDEMSAAFLYYNMVKNQWPDTEAAEKARKMLAQNAIVEKMK